MVNTVVSREAPKPTQRPLSARVARALPWVLPALLTLCAAVPQGRALYRAMAWQGVFHLVDARHPGLREMTQQRAQTALAEGRTFVDVRTVEEFQASHIPGALFGGGENLSAFAEDHVAELRQGPVVVYCSVGWRSAEAASRLRSHGIDAHNLRGGVFLWAQAGYPLTATRVHPYNALFGLLLPSDVRSPAAAR